MFRGDSDPELVPFFPNRVLLNLAVREFIANSNGRIINRQEKTIGELDLVF